jgi:capsular polysaccharide biosynthesis protein
MRRWWAIVIGAVLVAAAAFPFVAGGPREYQSTTTISVQSPPSQRGSDPDRYVSGQIAVLKSQPVTEAVAADLQLDPGAIAGHVSMAQVNRTDLIAVTASDRSPQLAQRIADLYVAKYIDIQQKALDDARQQRISAIDQQLVGLQNELALINNEIAFAVARYPAGPAGQLPTLDIIAPVQQAQRASKEAEYTDLVATRTQLVYIPEAGPATDVVQPASSPVPTASSSLRVLPLVLAAFLGAVICGCLSLLAARFSRAALIEEALEETLKVPLVGTVRLRAGVALDEATALHTDQHDEVLDEVMVRADAAAGSRDSVCVVVTSTERGVGGTALTVALAGRFRAHGVSVSVIDADSRHPELSSSVDGAVPLAQLQADLAADSGDEVSASRRRSLPFVIERARRIADVVVVDAGPLLESMASSRLCSLADAVVIAIGPRQRFRPLRRVLSPLSDLRVPLLPVTVKLRGRRRRRKEEVDISRRSVVREPGSTSHVEPPSRQEVSVPL